MGASLNTNNEGLKQNNRIEQPNADTQKQLAELREKMAKGKFDAVVDSLIGVAKETANGVPQNLVDTFIKTLTGKERQTLERLLSGTDDPKKAMLKKRLASIATTLPVAPPETAGGSAAEKVIGAIDAGITRMTSGNDSKLNELAGKLGFKGEMGPKVAVFIKDALVGFAAKLFESVAMSLRNINPTTDVSSILKMPLDLRLSQIKNADPAKQKNMRDAYANLYLERAKLPGVFVAPTMAEVLASEKSTLKQGETAPISEKLTGKRILTLPDNSTMEVSRIGEETTVSVAGLQRKLKTKERILDVFIQKAQNQNASDTIELAFVNGTSKKIDVTVLRNAVRDKKKDITIDTVKLEFIDIQNA